MPYYVLDPPAKSAPRKYHLSKDCPMVRDDREKLYKLVSSPPQGYTPCTRSGACTKLTK